MRYSKTHQMDSVQDQLNNAIWRASLVEVTSLLFAGASSNEPDSKGWTPLMQAAEGSNTQIINLLLRSGADVKKRGIENLTCLHIAVDMAIDGTIQNDGLQGKEATDVIELLLNNGADIFARNDNEKTPLDLALDYKSAKIIRLLEEKL